jgi:ketosteroid isomerase-like protein
VRRVPDPSRDEVETEFQRFVERGAANDWSAWADQFTDDALYIEHAMGTFRGREAIRDWITTTMAAVSGMSFPVEWHVIDGNRVIMYCWNVFDPLPGMTGEYRFAVVTILEYAGGGRWASEEDIYNEKEAEAVLARFLEDATAAGHAPPTGPDT